MAERVWTIRDALDWTVGYLGDKDIEHPRLSAEWLLSAATGLSRVELYTQFARPLSAAERDVLREGVKRRAAGEPLQYVTGEMPFRHIVLYIRPGVFIPRPETEVLVDVVLEHLKHVDESEPLVIDLCTGSGAVALSVAVEHPTARVVAIELSPQAARIARENAKRLGVEDRVEILEGDLFEPLDLSRARMCAVVVSNPPYIPTADVSDLAEEILGYEPHLALDGGEDGLDIARKIAVGARDLLSDGGLIAMELDERRIEVAAQELHQWYEGVGIVSDLAGRGRIVTGVRR